MLSRKTWYYKSSHYNLFLKVICDMFLWLLSGILKKSYIFQVRMEVAKRAVFWILWFYDSMILWFYINLINQIRMVKTQLKMNKNLKNDWVWLSLLIFSATSFVVICSENVTCFVITVNKLQFFTKKHFWLKVKWTRRFE